jgi:enamine deaminase RidA (YjgF/YER057c/UK114 family)
MAHTAIVSEQAKPVANYQMATRQESGRLIYISGQVAWDAEGNTVGRGDIRIQARQVFQNLRQVLQEAGGDLSDLLKITTYVTRLDDYPAVVEVRQEFFPGGLPASTLIVVESLFHADWLLEVEGIAAIGV